MPEWRKDPVTGGSVIIATERAKRPPRRAPSASAGDAEPCPFCPGNETMTPPEVLAYRESPGIPNGPGWTVRVVPNKYPALVDKGISGDGSEGPYPRSSASGVHEVIIETPDHLANAGALDGRQLAAVLRAYRDRMLALSCDRRWRSVLIFKNQGDRAGATLEHSHSQLMAFPHVPKALEQELSAARSYLAARDRCIYCDTIRREREAKERCIGETEAFVYFCPYGGRFPYETWILPKAHSPFFERMADAAYPELAACLKDILQRLNGVLPDAELNYILHSSPWEGAPTGSYHWHLEILPRVAQIAGFELGSGFFINTVAPEQAAAAMRRAAPAWDRKNITRP